MMPKGLSLKKDNSESKTHTKKGSQYKDFIQVKIDGNLIKNKAVSNR